MCCPCMIATIPLVTGNKLNCFISARGMLAIIRHCDFVLLFFVFFCVVVFSVDFLYFKIFGNALIILFRDIAKSTYLNHLLL